MLGTAGDVAIDVAVLLEAARDAGDDERFESAEHGGAADAGIASPKAIVEVLGGDAATDGGQRIGDEQALARDALAGRGQPVGSGGGIEGRGSHRAEASTH